MEGLYEEALEEVKVRFNLALAEGSISNYIVLLFKDV